MTEETSSRSGADERGAVAVVIALLMVPLIGFAAISIDVAAMWAERQQLQNGADAAAIGVAQACAGDGCGDSAGTAAALTTANVADGTAEAQISELQDDQVTVATSGVRQHLFAPVLGIRSSTIAARASAAWGAIGAASTALPLALSWCDYQALAGGGPAPAAGAATILRTPDPAPEPSPALESASTSPEPTETEDPWALAPPVLEPDPVPQPEPEPAAVPTCAGPRGNPVPIGFGWLDTERGTCRASSSIAAGAGSSAVGAVDRAATPASCSAADFSELQGRPVVLPIFDERTGPAGRGGHYRIYGYAALVLTGYHFSSSFSSGAPCGGSDSCVSGSFTRAVELSEEFTTTDDAPQLGAAVVTLAR